MQLLKTGRNSLINSMLLVYPLQPETIKSTQSGSYWVQMPSMAINTLLEQFSSLTISDCLAPITKLTSKMQDFGPNKELKNQDSIMHLLHVLQFLTTLNGEDSTKLWDKKMISFKNMLNLL